MFDLSYYYTLQKKEAVMRMMRKFGSVGCKQHTHPTRRNHRYGTRCTSLPITTPPYAN